MSEQEQRSKEVADQKPPGKLGAEKLTPAEQRRRFIEGAREAGASEDVEAFRANLRKIAKPKKNSAST
ncbi:hypothetical protein FPV16_22170 [Methylobacterium sp. W2]|uniref:hypothetical protein n=1 Tax=Methylobacterium sp. W2 TaxID=2598107 RepID=UPI001D0CB882|nr:hypothetical protein [Methylobacterium sp. W2]MCC0808873.1 hypothetical protein [Methylobacterium sp. W2]